MNVIRPFIVFSIGGNVEREKPLSRAVAGALCFSFLLLLGYPGVSAQSVTFPDRTGSIEVLVEPEDAEILLDNKPVGKGEVELDGLEPGSYKVTVRLDGHYSETRYLTLRSGDEVELQFVLEPVVGFLDVDVAPTDARVLVGEEEVKEFPAKLPVGTYVVEARRFGYIPERKRVLLGESVVTTLSFDLSPAPFELTDLLVSKRRFNPANPGEVGATRISFRVSTYGEGRFVVRREGRLVYSDKLGPFNGWEQTLLWHGDDSNGTALPEGEYQFEIVGRGTTLGSEERHLSRLQGRVAIDRRIVSRYRSIFSGSSGLLYAPLAEPLGPGTTQVSTQALAYAGARDNWYAPVVLGSRFGLGLPTALTLTAGPLISSDGGSTRLMGSVAFDWRYFQVPQRLSFGTVLKGSIASPVEGSYGGRDERTNPTGVSLQHPMTLYLGPVYLTAAPELYFGPDRVSYAETPENGGGIWSYLRGGIGFDGGLLSLGASGAVRSSLLSEEVDYEAPIALGAEAHLRVPSSPLYFSLLFAGDLYPDEENWRLKGGFGAGILF